MDASNRLHTALTSAMLQLLRPLCRLLLRHNIPFGVLEELAKHAYVQVAMADFGIPGKKPSMSRASILTGLTRKDVQRLVTGPEPARAVPSDGYNRAARVLTGWARDAHYQDEFGQPLPLSVQDGEHNFAELVRRHSGDMPVRAVLDELVRVGAVARRDDQLLEMVARAYVPKASEVDKLGILGTDVADLIATIDHNLQHGDTDPRYQRKVMYLSIPYAVVPDFKRESATRAQALLEHLDRWLEERDTTNPDDQPDVPRVRLGLGIYHIEAPEAPTFPKEN
ncbi:hypothetical protein BurJ1DRAFT_3979 [Burkholderiales bacterium JOSHI_001]|nr:hypothetical protein BurJ1DRAFT_3979 [Burkholderiales bacterium JOSHI_001]